MRPIATADLETDPFEYGLVVQPFAFGFYDGKNSVTIWNDNPKDLIRDAVDFLMLIKDPHVIYFHNGGRFDLFYFLEHLGAQLRIVNGRIIQCHIRQHEIRDSFAIMPFPLRAYKKDDIDYAKLHKSVRHKNRDEIISYLSNDCKYLYELVTRFHQEFGDSLTIGSTSMKQLKKISPFATGGESYDKRFREHFYFGGRNQVFESGIIKEPVKIFDVNSMYPYVMESMLHPTGIAAEVSKRVERNTCFVVAEGWNYGAFPTRTKTGGLDFTVKYGRFSVSIHEWRAAEETRTFKPHKIIKTYGFDRRESFDKFVTHFYESRKVAKAGGDKILDIFYKFVLNSAYGKFAQNPNNYFEWQICVVGERPEPWYDCTDTCKIDHAGLECPREWQPHAIYQNVYWLWKKHLDVRRYFNVCTGASITGGARSILLRGLVAAEKPIYCDTDSIICRDLKGVTISDSELGAWKLEASGTLAAIAGKKLYAIYDGSVCIKKAHKGSRLSGDEIISISRGATVQYKNPVPAYKLDGGHQWISRNIKRTV